MAIDISLNKMKKMHPSSRTGLAIAIEPGNQLRRKYNTFGKFVEMVAELDRLGYVKQIDYGYQDGPEYIDGVDGWIKRDYDRKNCRYDSYTDMIITVYLKKNNPMNAKEVEFYVVEHYASKYINGVRNSLKVQKYVRPNSKNGRYYQEVIAKAKLVRRK